MCVLPCLFAAGLALGQKAGPMQQRPLMRLSPHGGPISQRCWEERSWAPRHVKTALTRLLVSVLSDVQLSKCQMTLSSTDQYTVYTLCIYRIPGSDFLLFLALRPLKQRPYKCRGPTFRESRGCIAKQWKLKEKEVGARSPGPTFVFNVVFAFAG